MEPSSTHLPLLQSLADFLCISWGSASLHPRLSSRRAFGALRADILGRSQNRLNGSEKPPLTPLVFALFHPDSNIITDNGLLFRSAIFVSPTRLTTQSSVQIPTILDSSGDRASQRPTSPLRSPSEKDFHTYEVSPTVRTSLVPTEPFFVSETQSGGYRFFPVESCCAYWTFEISSRSSPGRQKSAKIGGAILLRVYIRALVVKTRK